MTADERKPFDVLGTLAKRWLVVSACTILGGGAGVAYALLAPEWFAATLTVVPSQHPQDSAALAVASKLPIALDTFQTDVQRIQAVLQSNSVADQVIAKFGLQDRYSTAHIEKARAALADHCGSSVDRKSGVVSLTCEDKDPKFAMDMAAYFGEVGNKVFGRVSVSSAREERAFLEQQVQKARKDVEESSRKLREFQEQHKVIDLPEQAKAVISAMAQLQGEMLSKQLELSYVRGFSSGSEANVVQLQQQISIMQSKLKQLEDSQRGAPAAAAAGSGSASGSGSAAFFPNAMSVPELRFELEQLMRDQKIQETVFGLMTQRYEMAKVDEARDTSTFQILDYPTLPTYRSRPKRTSVALTGIFAGFVLGVALVLGPAWWRQRAKAMA